MNTHHPTLDGPATADYVLSVLQDEYRQWRHYERVADRTGVLSFDSTVEEWRDACDLPGWRDLGKSLNERWGIRCSHAQWRAALKPATRRNLRDVCDLIAGHARRAKIRPVTILGRVCGPAAAFLAVRSVFHEAGVPVEDIAPSTPLEPYAKRYPRVFLGPISRLAPGALPAVAIRQPVYDAGECLLVVGMMLCLLGELLRAGGADFWFVNLILGVSMTMSGYAVTWFAGTVLLPAEVRFGELRTFGDLAKCLVASDQAAVE